MNNQAFLNRLKAEASQQAQLHQHRLLPTQLDGVTAFIGRHAWQVLVVLSIGTSLVLELLQKI